MLLEPTGLILSGHEVYQFYTSRWGGRRTYEVFFTYWNMIGVSIQVCGAPSAEITK